jgi:hypothetical protein
MAGTSEVAHCDEVRGMETTMHGSEMAYWLSVSEGNGSACENRTGPISLGILTVTGHHYLRVPSIGTGDPAFFLIEDGSIVHDRFAIPAFELSISFESDKTLASFALAYAAAWQKEGELKDRDRDAVEAALRDSLAGEEKLLSLRVDEIPEALSWFDQRDPPGVMFRRCFSSTAGGRRASLAAHVELAKQFGVPHGERATVVEHREPVAEAATEGSLMVEPQAPTPEAGARRAA